jgi:retron-type reverse transcriptase
MLNNGKQITAGGGDFVVKKFFTHSYEDIISLENLLLAWKEFLRGKRKKADVQEFQYNLMENILDLHHDLVAKTYRHGGYVHFKISDPKSRDIHKASVRDRLLHHAIYRILYPYFDKLFIHDSYSCRNGKGTHRALNQFKSFANKVSKNHTKTCWVLKCDIKKFFARIDQEILLHILKRHIADDDILLLLQGVIESFTSGQSGKGLPLGNLTSQLLVNIYMNEFDQFVKYTLKMKHYIRYADDFVFLSQDRNYLEDIVRYIVLFLQTKLQLELHPNKVSISTFSSGVDFLGWIHFPIHRVLRTTSRKRMFRKVEDSEYNDAVVQSYLGLLSHGNGWKLKSQILKEETVIKGNG